MVLLNLSAKDLLTLHRRRLLIPHLAARWEHFKNTPASRGEREAWAESLIELAMDLEQAGRGSVQMLVECQPDGAPSPIDVVLAGRHPESGRHSAMLVELKRWSSVTQTPQRADKVDVPGLGVKSHPSFQLGLLYDYFTGDSGPLRDLQIEYGGFSYLHNAHQEGVKPLFAPGTATGPHALYYTRDNRDELRKDLQRQFDRADGTSIAELLLQRIGVRNSPLLTAMVTARGEDTVFTLRGDQRRALDAVSMAVERLTGDPRQEVLADGAQDVVFIVRGGAGSGKSALGLELMHTLRAKGYAVKYASGSRAFDAAMKHHAGAGDAAFKEQFVFFSSFIEPPVPRLDLLICDEAHRLRERSTNHRVSEDRWGTKPQVDELLDAARVTIFLLDSSQSVRPNEVGTIELIEAAAVRRGIVPSHYGLQDQFRCGGSDAYRQWVHALLGISENAPARWIPDGLMHVEVADSPEHLERIILREHHAGASARVVAGFCWPWNRPKGKVRRLVRDVRIGEWHRPWNAKSESTCERGAPPSKLWGVRPEGVHQIGCIYTAQGLEWDWCGVIMGDDMVWRNGEWRFQRAKLRKEKAAKIWRIRTPGSADEELRKKGIDDERLAECVRNAYHVLLTRASRATVIYSTDPETQEYLKDRVGDVEIMGLRPTWENLPPEARRQRPDSPPRRRSGRKPHLDQPGLF